MPAYVRRTIGELVQADPRAILGLLQQAYAADGFSSQYTRQTKAWHRVIPMLQSAFRQLLSGRSDASEWAALLEYPLYRLRRRIDLVVLAGDTIVVVECKVGGTSFTAEDVRQAEEYALDLRDFHAASHGHRILPVLWSTDADNLEVCQTYADAFPATGAVAPVTKVGAEGLENFLASLPTSGVSRGIVAEQWDRAPYRPVPNVIEAATSIFAGHDVRSIANADADNLRSAAARLVRLIQEAQQQGRRYLLLLTGVPGSGKTLAGLHVVHSAVATGVESRGDIVYLSGNTPLVEVLREALARDERDRGERRGERRSLNDIRREVRARIQHINDFLKQSLHGSSDEPPHEHVIVFDEAQRAWDEKQGFEKFDRTASEPALLLELMSRHQDWCACVCLVGGGQEINSGEEGVLGWGEALRRMDPQLRRQWSVYAPPDVLSGGASAGSFTLGPLPPEIAVTVDANLQLTVPQRSYRSPSLSRWVNEVLAGDASAARCIAQELGSYPVMVTRSLPVAKDWLRRHGRGERRYGLVASSGARRLRADGLGEILNVSDRADIAHWYLNPPGDIRSSYALEVPANEYTCQGLELDFVCVCWGGDLLWDSEREAWSHSRLSGTSWHRVKDVRSQRYLENSYRVLLTRARQGLVLWVPEGDALDPTRDPGRLSATADYLERCGAERLGGD